MQHSLPMLVVGLGLLSLVSAAEETSPGVNSHRDEDHKGLDDLDMDKRLYDFGLGKRAYSYVSEYKRLPVYNFGLGKRASRYEFGLGKRSESNDEVTAEDYADYQYQDDEDKVPELELYDDDDMQTVDKRQKMYSFGLGKRVPRYEFGLGKRAGRFEFGLGKKSPRFGFGLGKRDPSRLYSFGLGKRGSHMYSFGLGKRPSERGQSQSRFNFGLGKRSNDLDTYPQIYKREVNPKDVGEESNSAETDDVHASSGSEQHNDTVEADSHEMMGHSDRSSHFAKRSARYEFGLGKRTSYQQQPSSFSREYRKPLYNFGLGKRRPMYDFGLGKRSYEP